MLTFIFMTLLYILYHYLTFLSYFIIFLVCLFFTVLDEKQTFGLCIFGCWHSYQAIYKCLGFFWGFFLHMDVCESDCALD